MAPLKKSDLGECAGETQAPRNFESREAGPPRPREPSGFAQFDFVQSSRPKSSASEAKTITRRVRNVISAVHAPQTFGGVTCVAVVFQYLYSGFSSSLQLNLTPTRSRSRTVTA